MMLILGLPSSIQILRIELISAALLVKDAKMKYVTATAFVMSAEKSMNLKEVRMRNDEIV